MNKTSVVILNWNGIGYLRMFLGTVVRFTAGPGREICVADNGSTDGSADWVAANFRDVRVIRLDKNYGFAEGYNKALSQIDAKYFVLLNSDIEVTEGWLDPLADFMEKNPDVASCQPKILDYNRRDHFEHAGAAGCFIDKYGYPFCRGRILNIREKDSGQYDSLLNIFWSSGACMIVRADAWNICGGFDSSFFAHMEEIDLCWRFNRAGYRVFFVPGTAVYHMGGGSLSYESPFKIYLNFRNSLFMLYKNLPDNRLQPVMFIRMLLDGLAALLFLLKGNAAYFRSVWKAHLGYYRSIRELKIKRAAVKKLGNNNSDELILNKSIIFEFYFKGLKTYDRLKTQK
jgi:GT2 family glycosyltransferase